MPGPSRCFLLPWVFAAGAFALGAGAAACGKAHKEGGTTADARAAPIEALASLARFREKVGFKALHTGPRKLPMVFRLGEEVPEGWVPVIQRTFDAWESGVGKDLFAFAGGTLSGRASVRVKAAAVALAVPFEDGFWSIVSSKKGLCPKKTGDSPAACARFTPARDEGGSVVDWSPIEQDVIFDVGSYEFHTEAATGDAMGSGLLALSLRQVLAHELGHVLGLPHTTPAEGASIMGSASIARKGVYAEEGPGVPQALDYEKARKLVSAWEAEGVE